MPHYKHLIVGGGMTGAAAAKGIRQIDEHGSIGMISAEPDPPYNRPPLSKGLWKGKPVEKIWRKTPEQDVEIITDCQVKAIHPAAKSVITTDGADYTYDRLLLATGGSPRRLPFGGDAINYYRTFRDYERLREETEQKQRFAVIGGGFIGSEIAAALKMVGKDVVMIFPEEGIGSLVYPADLSRYLVDYYRENGIEVRAGELVSNVEQRGEQVVITGNGDPFTVDVVVAGIGIQPNVELAKAAGLNVGNGIPVDEYLRTSASDIYAAGDVAEFYNPALDQRMRVEHEDNANTMGETAGKNMAGEMTRYDHLPMFYSDLFDLGYEAVGDLNSKLEVFSDWQEPYQKGVLYYLKDGQVRGVLLWNVWDQVDNARALIREGRTYKPHELKGRLPA